jgi:hypothetical protein
MERQEVSLRGTAAERPAVFDRSPSIQDIASLQDASQTVMVYRVGHACSVTDRMSHVRDVTYNQL